MKQEVDNLYLALLKEGKVKSKTGLKFEGGIASQVHNPLKNLGILS